MSNAKNILRDICTNEQEVDYYYGLLLTCDTAKEIARKVIMPLLANDRIKENEACKEAFYLTLAHEIDPDEKRIKRSTLHDNIRHAWKELEQEKEKDKLVYQNRRYSDGCDIRIQKHPNGVMEFVAHLQFCTTNPKLIEKFMPAIESLHAVLRTFTEKHFDARGQAEGIAYEVECRTINMPALINRIQAIVSDETFRVNYISVYTEQQHITLEEAREIATIESVEDEN